MIVRYKWHGEPVKVIFGFCRVSENKEKPMWWYNFECNNKLSLTDDYVVNRFNINGLRAALIPAIKVIYKDQTFVIANHFGIGVSKLKKGGWPNHCHFSLPVESFQEGIMRYKAREFNEEGYSRHESERRKWQKKEFPEEFKRMETLRSAAIGVIK